MDTHRYGVPSSILTNNASTFANQRVTKLLTTLHIKYSRATPHHSQGNSLAERALQSLQEKIASLTTDQALNGWDRALPMAVLALNKSVHNSVGYPPFVLMFGRRPPIVSHISTSATTLYDIQADLIQKTLESIHAY